MKIRLLQHFEVLWVNSYWRYALSVLYICNDIILFLQIVTCQGKLSNSPSFQGKKVVFRLTPYFHAIIDGFLGIHIFLSYCETTFFASITCFFIFPAKSSSIKDANAFNHSFARENLDHSNRAWQKWQRVGCLTSGSAQWSRSLGRG